MTAGVLVLPEYTGILYPVHGGVVIHLSLLSGCFDSLNDRLRGRGEMVESHRFSVPCPFSAGGGTLHKL